ncbi:MAG: C25 family cysteine peptidase [Ignavibacteria bacterium]|nr:C25 family cysteine peptidase [Ignavibacteria bacterium]
MRYICFYVCFVNFIVFSQVEITKYVEESNKISISCKFELPEFILENVNSESNLQYESAYKNITIPSKTLLIGIPFTNQVRYTYTIVQNEQYNATDIMHHFDKKNEVQPIEANLISKLKNKESDLQLKGKFWLDDVYTLHFEVFPFSFNSSSKSISGFTEIEIEIFLVDPIMTSNKAPESYSKLHTNSEYANKYKNLTHSKLDSDTTGNWIDYQSTYVKLGVFSDGIYEINSNDLTSLGINVNSLDPRTFKLMNLGVEVPIFVAGENDGYFEANDYIEFVGQRNLTGKHRLVSNYGEPYNEYIDRYTDTTIYWLTWGGGEGKRVEIVNTSGLISTLDTIKYYNQVLHYENNVVFDFSMADLVRRELPFWTENKTWIWNLLGVGTRNITFTVSDKYPGKTVKLFSKLQSYASSVTSNAHLLAISLNSSQLQDSGYINKYQQKVIRGDFNSDLLVNGNNTFKVHSFATSANPNSCAFDWAEIEYPRYLKAINDSLLFSFPFLENLSNLRSITVTNLLTDTISVWKFGTSLKKYITTVSNNKITFYDTITNHDKFVLIASNKVLKPKIFYKKEFTNLRNFNNQADYLAVTHKKFLSRVIDYNNFIQNTYGVTPKAIDIDDVYDEFSYGYFNPEAIKLFLKSSHTYWQYPLPKYVTLIGAATYDYHKNKYLYAGSPLSPVYVPSFGASVSDNWFVTWDTTGAYIPQMNIGRIPVKSEAEFQSYFNKHVNYVNNPFNEWNKNYLFFSGGTGTDQNQLNQLREVNNFVLNNYVTPAPVGGNSTHFYKTINPTTNFGPYTAEQIQNAIDNGAVFISYLGHSGTQTWDNSITQPAQLKNKVNRNPLITDFGCSTARFAEPDVTSFSQLFVLSNDGQAIAYIGNASLGFLSTSTIAPKLFYKKVLQDSVYNISEALKLAKLEMLQTYGSSGVYQLFALTNTLIGDPIINLAIPPKPNLSISSGKVELSNANPTDDLDSISITISYLNVGKVLPDSFYIKVYSEYTDSSNLIYQSRRLLPRFSDSLFFSLMIKNKPGIHKIRAYLDSENEISEITENDNLLQFSVNVASTSLRTTFLNEIENGSDDSIFFLNPVGKPQSDTLIIQQSNNPAFDFTNTLYIQFDTLFTKVSLSNLNSGNRYWIRSKVKNSESYGKTNSFVNNSIRNYYLSDKISFSSSELNKLKYSDNRLELDSKSHIIYAMSAGFHDGRSVVISINTQNFIPDNLLRGHHICVFNDSTYEFVLYKRFDTYSGGANITDYITFLDTLSTNYIIAIAVADEGRVTSVPLKNQLKSIGSKYIDSLVFRGSWAIIGKKGAVPGSVPEAFTIPYGGRAEVDTTIYKRYNSGSLLTSSIGPVAKWDDINVEQQMESNSSIAFRPVGIRESGEIDTLNYLTLNNNSASLGHVDASVYPHIKILADFNASSDSVSPSLSSLAVNFKRLPELGVNYQTVSLSKDSIIVGDSIKISAMAMNLGETTAEDVKVVFELIRPDNTKRILFAQSIQEFHPFERKRFECFYNATRWEGVGDFSVNVIVDSGNNIKELFKDNNIYRINFKVNPDTVKSIVESAIEMTVNSKEIFDGDFIPSNPDIKIELHYPTWFEVGDSTAVQFYLNDNKLTTEQFSGISFDTTNRTMTFNYKNLLTDGEYRLKIFSKDINGILSNTPVFERFFVVYNELKIKQVYNYPNPFTEGTNFTFELTQVPDEVVIRIYTVSGRLIREIKTNSSINFNYLYWDGRDQDGDVIANGVYLYKVIARLGDKTEHITEKLAKIR